MRLIQQFLARNACYVTGKAFKPIGVIVHSTGANNPNTSRYVPGNGVIGLNTKGTHWNVYHPSGRDIGKHTYVNRDGDYTCDRCGGRQVCVHAFIGKLADGSVGTVQTLPWAMRAWHAGKSKGNNQYIGFEICEDGLDDPAYFAAVYREAVELTAYLCRLNGWDPTKPGVVICHAEGYRRGVASNHGDVLHWFPRHGKTMDDFRADVARELEGGEDMTQGQFDSMMEDWLQRQGEKPVSGWAEKLLAEAKARGITDGTRPQAFATRQEVALMVSAAKK